MNLNRLLFFPMRFEPTINDGDWDAIESLALARAAGFDGVIVATRCWQELPDVVYKSQPMDRIFDICRLMHLDIILCRDLWSAWPTLASYPPRATDHLNQVYYLMAIQRIKAEAAAIGAYSMLDCEPCGDSLQRSIAALQPDEWFSTVNQRIRWATERVGKPDFVTPCDGNSAMPAEGKFWYAHAFKPTGVNGLSQDTYDLNSADSRVNPTPPGWPAHTVEWRGVWVDDGHISIPYYRRIEAAYPKTWVYTTNVAKTLRQLV